MPDAPKPAAGYIVAEPGWDPKRTPAVGWMPRSTLKEAEAELAAYRAQDPNGDSVILKVVTTYTVVKGGKP